MMMIPSDSAHLEVEHRAQRARVRALSGRFDSAARLLSSPVEGERVAGIALLHSLWEADEQLGEPIEDVLSALVRRRAISTEVGDRLPPDVQAALSALGNRPPALQNRPLDLSGAHLRGVEWPMARLSGAHLNACDLRGALLVGADLRGAWLRGANLQLANLDGANVCGADLRGALGCDQFQLRGARSDQTTRWPQF